LHWPTALAAGAAVMIYLALRAHALEGGAAAGVALNFKTQALTAAPALLGKCTQAMLWPYEISVNHLRRWLVNAHPAWWYGGAAATVAQLSAALWLWRRGQRVAAFGFLWWLGSLIPVLLIGVLGWPGLHRWFYMGSPGLFWGLGGLFLELGRGRNLRSAGAGVAAVVALGFSLQAQRAIPVWWSGDRLFGAMVEEHPDVSFGYIGLGAWLLEHHRYDEAEKILRQSIALDVVRNDGFFFLSRTLAAKGDCAGAVQVVQQRTVTLDPSVAWAAGKCYAEKRGDHVNAHRYFKLCETNYTDCSDGVAKAIEVGAVPDPNVLAPASAAPAALPEGEGGADGDDGDEGWEEGAGGAPTGDPPQ
ncbi:MAG: hypothetical protein KC613_25455, partial [Myxococcales bacterium]|nr:hypothetical protein [Myxococcales bacterium]